LTDAIVKLLAEVLCILAIATKEIKENCASKSTLSDKLALSAYCSSESFLKKLAGRSDIEDALQRLETVIVEEARMAATEALKSIHDVQNMLNTFGGMLQGVGDKLQDKLQDVDERVKDIDHKVTISAQAMVQLIISAILNVYTVRC
jgi:hypothetical protein